MKYQRQIFVIREISYTSLAHEEVTRQVDAQMQSRLVQSVLDTGVDRNSVTNVIERRLREAGTSFFKRYLTNCKTLLMIYVF